MSARLQISTTNRENVLTISLNSNNVKNLKKILGLIVTNKDEKFEVLNCFLLSAEIDVTEYFKNPCTLDELQEGVKELYQNVTDLESKDRDILIDFLLSNMYWGYIHDYTNEYVYDYGKSDSLGGEILRAVNRIDYRWHNDKDIYLFVSYFILDYLGK